MSSKGTTPPLTSGSTDSFSTSPDEEKSISRQNDGQILANPGPARPSHYLARGDGRFTPMIALDELPSNVRIGNLAVSMTLHEVLVLGGHLCTPALETSQEKYIVIGITDASTNHSGDVLASSAYPSKMGEIPSTGAINERLARALDGSGPSADPEQLKKSLLQMKAQKHMAANQRYNPTTPGVLGQKVYCTHWMRTGECDFTQQGCMFLHAMPDLDTLELLGFRSYPRWFREMPRQYQIQNATDFNEVGLDHQRHTRGISGPGNWHAQPSRYMGPTGPNFHSYPQPWSNMMPGQIEGGPYGSIDAPWRNTAFGQSHMSALPYRPRPSVSIPFDHFDPSNMQTSQANNPEQEPMRHSIWSRDNSPVMGIVNRIHKPLSPQVVSMQPRFRNKSNVNPFNRAPRSPSNQGRMGNNISGRNRQLSNANSTASDAAPKSSNLFKVNPHVRGRDLHRCILNNSPEDKETSDKHPIQEHSAGTIQAKSALDVYDAVVTVTTSARPRSATVETASESEAEAKTVDA